jgi:TctA family transporter
MLKSIAMVVLGLLLGVIGTDVNTGIYRLTFGVEELTDGLSFVVIAMGMFGVAEIVANLEKRGTREVFTSKVGRLMPTLRDIRDSWAAILRGTAIGSFLGILPGAGTTISSFLAYITEKRVACDPSRFGKGAIEGVAGPEAANNAAAQTAFIPTLTLGIPGSGTMALMLGALTIYGIQPGPRVMTSHPDLFWGLVASMWIGNLILVVLNLPLVGIWVQMLKAPYRMLYPSIVVLCCVGGYTLSNSTTDVVLLAVFGVVGYVLVKLECEPAPLLLGFVLGPMMEENLRRSMLLSRGDPSIFVTQPVSLALLLTAAVLLALLIVPAIRNKRTEAIAEGES